MIINIRHTGLVVRDIDKSIDFYSRLGFSLWKREVETGKFIDQVTGIENVRLEWAKLKSKDGSLIELLQYLSHPEQKAIKIAESNQLGCSHIAFTVDDIDKMCNCISDLGGAVVNRPAVSPDGMVRVAYCHDLDGILIELVDEL